MSLYFLFAGLGLLWLAAHPFTTYPVSLALIRRRWRQPVRPAAPGTSAPSFSLLVCAHNEARVIEDKVANLRAVLDRAPGPAEALIYVDGSSDATADLARASGDSRIKVIVSAQRTGKTAGLGRLVQEAQGDLLVLSDANVMVAADSLERLARHFADPTVGLVCGHLCYLDPHGPTARNGALYWRLEETIRQLESETGSVVGADGSLYAVRRSLWPAVPDDLIDDFYVPMTVRFAGLRVVRAADVVACERSAEDGRDEFARKVRIACQAFNVHRRLWPRIRAQGGLDLYKYVSHKLLKWLAGFHLLAAGGCLAGASVLALGWPATLGGTALGVLTLNLARLAGWSAAASMLDALAMFAAVSLGVLRSCRGERFQIWQPAASVRAGAPVFGSHPPERAN